ncbi:hypothetical protein FACS189413_13720 [Bacteroidia bacterium]|nr:hypothetical protein FACS189413_13720 [Bacteroidia bacterium]
MKSINKFGTILLAVVALFAVSCDEEIVRDPSPEANSNSQGVFFPEQDKSALTLGVSDAVFEVKLAREVSETALTVALKSYGKDADKFTVPASASFAAGEKVTSVEVTLGDIKLLTTYQFTIQIDDASQIANPYVEDAGYAILALSILKEDFVPYADGIYTDPFWNTEPETEIVLEYSAATELYRLQGLFDGGGEAFLFGWDGDKTITVQDGSGPKLAAYIAGGYDADAYYDDTYGWVYAYFVKDQTRVVGGASLAYNAATKTFTFPIFWGFASGSGFGWKVSTYQITSLY